MDKTLYFRFDIDTISCIRDGIDRLLALGERLDVRFTFFANMGKSISRREVLLRSPGRTVGNVLPSAGSKVSVFHKLGPFRTLQTVLLNPDVGFSNIAVLEKILRAGHELGLHGGDNHSTWQRNADHYTRPEVVDALLATHERFCHHFGAPRGFASPGGTGSPIIYAYLQELGYQYVSDHMEQFEQPVFTETCSIRHIPVNLQINQVPILESLYARTPEASDLHEQAIALVERTGLKTGVGHPCFEGKLGFGVFEKFATALRQKGYDIKPYAALCPDPGAAR